MNTYEYFAGQIDQVETLLSAFEEAGNQKEKFLRDRNDLNELRKKLSDQFSKRYGIVNMTTNQQYSVPTSFSCSPMLSRIRSCSAMLKSKKWMTLFSFTIKST